MIFWIIQSLGIFALIFYIVSFQMKKKENLLLMQVSSNIFTAIQYILTMALTGVVQTILGIIRGVVFYFYKKRGMEPERIALVIFAFAIIIGAWFTWDDVSSFFPLVAMIANLYGQWQDDMKLVRILAIVSAILWSVYALYIGVYTAMLTEVFKIVSSLIGLWRYRKEQLLKSTK